MNGYVLYDICMLLLGPYIPNLALLPSTCPSDLLMGGMKECPYICIDTGEIRGSGCGCIWLVGGGVGRGSTLGVDFHVVESLILYCEG